MKKITKAISTLAVFMFSAAIVGGCGGKEANKDKPQPAPTTLSCSVEDDHFCFIEKNDGTLELARFWNDADAIDNEITIPATFNNKNVTSVGSDAFMVYKSKYSMELNNAEFQGEFMVGRFVDFHISEEAIPGMLGQIDLVNWKILQLLATLCFVIRLRPEPPADID